MALYKTYEPCVIDAQLIRVDPEVGREILVSDDHVPSITWEAIDEPAQRAMDKLQSKRKLTQQAEFVLNPERIRAKFMAEYYKSLSEGVIDPELNSYELGAGREALEERASEIASRKSKPKRDTVPEITTSEG